MSQKSPENLYDLLIVKIKALYDTEQQLVKALPKMAQAATDADLKQAFTDHLEETKEHVTRLEEVFKLLDVSATTETSDAIRGLVSDAQWCIDNVQKGPALDASLIAAAQYVEHFEQAGYGSAAEWADTMNQMDVKNILGITLDEEEAADEKLTSLAESRINEAANTARVQAQTSDTKKTILGKFSEAMQ